MIYSVSFEKLIIVLEYFWFGIKSLKILKNPLFMPYSGFICYWQDCEIFMPAKTPFLFHFERVAANFAYSLHALLLTSRVEEWWTVLLLRMLLERKDLERKKVSGRWDKSFSDNETWKDLKWHKVILQTSWWNVLAYQLFMWRPEMIAKKTICRKKANFFTLLLSINFLRFNFHLSTDGIFGRIWIILRL
jgi:hypothetical protein